MKKTIKTSDDFTKGITDKEHKIYQLIDALRLTANERRDLENAVDELATFAFVNNTILSRKN